MATPALTMSRYDSSLPTEIWAIIIEDVKSEYVETRPKDPKYIRFIPQWYLTPLLRVSKQWYAGCVRYLYRSVAIGSHAPFQFRAREGETDVQTRRRLHIANEEARKGDEIAKDLCRTLTTCPRLAALVEKLQLGVELLYNYNALEWTQTNTRILQLCPNVEHVEIRGFEFSKLHPLVNVLKEKSLVSLSINTRRLSDSQRRRGGTFSQTLEMIQKWPKLRSIEAEDFLNDEVVNNPTWLDTIQASSRCCPYLTEIIFSGAALHARELECVRAMCSRDVEKLHVSMYGNRVSGNGDAAAVALCECLRAWSSTLQCLKISIRGNHDPYPLMSEAIASLYELRELQLNWTKLDFGFVSNLPRLVRLRVTCRWDVSLRATHEEMQNLSRHLVIPGMFSSLRLIALFLGGREISNELRDICRRRNIQLHELGSAGPRISADFIFLL